MRVRIAIVTKSIIRESALEFARETTTFVPYLMKSGKSALEDPRNEGYLVVRKLEDGDEFNSPGWVQEVDQKELEGL